MVRWVAGAVSNALIVILLVLVVAFAGVRLVGLTPYAVLSGSMEPELPVGSLIYVREVDPATIQPGDAVTFEKSSGSIVTHEAYEIDYDAGLIYTQGINNRSEDGTILHDGEPVAFTRVIGVPVVCVPLLGYVNALITTPPGIACACIVACVSVALSFIAGRSNGFGDGQGSLVQARHFNTGRDDR